MTKIELACNLINNSFISNYYSNSIISNQLSNIVEINDNEEFMNLYGHKGMDRLEGFNRNNKSYIGPVSTPHTVIHETLHNLSSSFALDGKRILNGIELRDGSVNNTFLLNEGLTDYLSTKISGEQERNGNYITGVKFFRRLDYIIDEIYGKNNLLFEGYISNNTYFLEEFINKFCSYKYKGKTVNYSVFKEIFAYLNQNEIISLCDNIELNALKNYKKKIIFNGHKDIDFNKNNELYIIGIIKKAYYDLKYKNKVYTQDQINYCMSNLINNNDPQYITNIRGVRNLLTPLVQNYSLYDIVVRNKDGLKDIGVDNFINNDLNNTFTSK